MQINKIIDIFKLLAHVVECYNIINGKKFKNEFKIIENKMFSFCLELQMFSLTEKWSIKDVKDKSLKNSLIKTLIVFEVYKNILLTAEEWDYTNLHKHEKTLDFSLLYVLNFFSQNQSVFKAEANDKKVFFLEKLNRIIRHKINKLNVVNKERKNFVLEPTEEEISNLLKFSKNFDDNRKKNFNEINEGRKSLESLSETDLTENEKSLYILSTVSRLNSALIQTLKEDMKNKNSFHALSQRGSFVDFAMRLEVSKLVVAIKAFFNLSSETDEQKKVWPWAKILTITFSVLGVIAALTAVIGYYIYKRRIFSN